MDYPTINLDFYYILTEYSMHIFICAIVGFGSLIYCLSIRTPKSDFESPKLLKKKYKKEKPLRSKTVNKTIPPKIEITENVNIPYVPVKETIIMGVDMNEDDINSATWQPVVKPKRVSKNDKLAGKTTRKVAPPPNNNDCDNIKSSVLSSHKAAPIIAKELNSVIEPICDKIKKIEPIDITEKRVPTIEKSEIISLKQPQKPQQHQEPSEEVVEQQRNQSESPTNSLSDDFELVDVYKTSSEDGLKIEIDPVDDFNEAQAAAAAISSTSGASRKKNKKHQKLISKQLIEAAAIDIERESTESAAAAPDKSNLTSAAAAAAAKKKRPRKDV